MFRWRRFAYVNMDKFIEKNSKKHEKLFAVHKGIGIPVCIHIPLRFS